MITRPQRRPHQRYSSGTRASLARIVVVVAVATAAVQAGSALANSQAGTVSSSACPTAWTCGDIGGAVPAGGQAVSAETWTVEGGGANIWGQSDAFHFVWQGIDANGSVSAQVLSQANTDQNAKAGVMFRSSPNPDASYYGVFLTPQHGLAVQYRSADGQAALNGGGNSDTVPTYVEAVRSGSTFTAMTSSDGTTWTKVSGSTKTVPGLAGSLLAGLAVTSHNVNLASTAAFGAVQVLGANGPGGPGATTTTSSPTTTTVTPDSTSTTTTTTTVPSSTSTTTTAPASTTTTTTPPTTTTTTTTVPGSTGGQGAAAGLVSVCGTALCVDGSRWSMYGSTVYNPGLKPYRSGLKNPSNTVALAEVAHLNTIRITDFLNVTGSPGLAPYDESKWKIVDAMIAAAGAAGLHVDLGLADYRAILWNSCINPYTADWSRFISNVANRVNTVTHVVYKDDPAIAFVSVTGEPLPVGTHSFTAKATGQPCSLSYSTSDLTAFYADTTSEWMQQGGTVLINSGGLGYLNESHSGIDWKSIFSLPTNAFCDIKTYGGMQAWAPNAASYCKSIGKPMIVEEFGWQQTVGDAQRAQLFANMFAQLRTMNVAGIAFWNLGYQLAPTSYEISTATPWTFAIIGLNAP